MTAFVVRDPRVGVSRDDLDAHTRAYLAGYKRPRDVVFVSDLPRGPTGKVLRSALREQPQRSEEHTHDRPA